MSFISNLQDSRKYPSISEKYEFGFPDLLKPCPVFIQVREDEVEFKAFLGFSRKKITLKADDIIEVGLNQETFRSAGKAAAGAIIGGILTGGIGLIAGAALGGKRRQENQLHLLVKYNGTECDIHLKPSNTIPQVYAALLGLMKKQAPKVTETTAAEAIEEKKNETSPSADLVKQLQDLHTLVDQGILTQEEFETQKKKLLS